MREICDEYVGFEMSDERWDAIITEVNREVEAERFRNMMCDIYPDDDTANKRLYRKRDRHKNKGKRRVRVGYEVKYV